MITQIRSSTRNSWLANMLPLVYRMRMGNNDQEISELQHYRDAIDGIDDQLIALLKERAGIVKKVGAFKHRTKPGICPIRPAREALMVKRVSDAFRSSDFPPAVAAAMWRLLIGGSTALEAPLPISTYAKGEDQELYWLAREYFGSFQPIHRQTSARRVIGDIVDGNAAVGVVPMIRTTDNEHWWPLVLDKTNKRPTIFAYIPYVFYGDQRDHVGGFALGALAPEPTGHDRTVLVLDTHPQLSQNKLSAVMETLKLDAKWLHVANFDNASRQHVLDVSGFVQEDSTEVAKITAELSQSLFKLHILGHYAKPITLSV